ncbi:hypothetical protein EV137_2297 [Kribbella pratensis]|uniref:Allene oxide cyclase barrel-like domain-containing protein n=1 Tax=Kribbella pratensis TaxID=2512112 RepID=A0ABY2FP94_9ACTN|nr:hypothetical protein [Kribbella pratensis]TDW94968.1 hypothetical protein EV137_2297 [Kribbella pratensis]
MRSLRIASFAIASACVVVGTSMANASPRCEQIDATIYDKVVTEGCPPPAQACVIGTARGKHGFDAKTVFVLGSRADPPSTSPGYRAVSGTITYTFKDGATLTALETSIGNVNTTTGLGHAGGTQEFTGGTGRYEGATGFTYLSQHFETDHFVTRIQGESCRAKS